MKTVFSRRGENIAAAFIPLVCLLACWDKNWITQIDQTFFEWFISIILVVLASSFYKYLLRKVKDAVFSKEAEDIILYSWGTLVFLFIVFFILMNVEKDSATLPLLKFTLIGYFSYSTAKCIYILGITDEQNREY